MKIITIWCHFLYILIIIENSTFKQNIRRFVISICRMSQARWTFTKYFWLLQSRLQSSILTLKNLISSYELIIISAFLVGTMKKKGLLVYCLLIFSSFNYCHSKDEEFKSSVLKKIQELENAVCLDPDGQNLNKGPILG